MTNRFAKYGLTEAEYNLMLNAQGNVCAICKKPSKRLCIDHEHVKGWKNLPDNERKLYVRGILCWQCNLHRVGRNTRANIQAVYDYLNAIL
jgi:hypothetical protein